MIHEKNFYYDKSFSVDDTNFMSKYTRNWPTNFSGKPDNYGNTARFCDVEIPPSMVAPLEDIGVNVKSWPKDPEAETIHYYVKLMSNFRDRFGNPLNDSITPKIYVHPETNIKKGVLHTEDMLEGLDEINVKSVYVTFRPTLNNNGGITLYLSTCDIIQGLSDDPHASMFGRGEDFDEPAAIDREPGTDEEELPFI